MARSFRVGTLDGFRPYAVRDSNLSNPQGERLTSRPQWLDSAAFGAAVVSDTLTAGALIVVLRNSRTGFKRYVYDQTRRRSADLVGAERTI